MSTGLVTYEVALGGGNDSVSVEIEDSAGTAVAKGTGLKGLLKVPQAKLWWPYSMSGQNFTHMYTLKVSTLQSTIINLPVFPT